MKLKRPKKKQGKQQKQQRRFLARWFLLIPAVLLLFAGVLMAWYYEPAQIWYRETRQERVLRATLAGIQEYNDELRDELASLETTEGVMEYARRELNFVVEGDNVIVVTRDGVPLGEPRSSREAVVSSIPENAQPFGAWTDFLDTVFDID
ncbi:MAG: septum formation initiator family protein [Coriobacteriia bacterium]|nr:septum formation initiator family protein [Coriobacteriia bacterium]MCL2745604.1 septum formation initiator family protein [Coriobacteriia bacterium]MCL2871317.1 septum formation initiator family protein [Coriobacteriia bacterium]